MNIEIVAIYPNEKTPNRGTLHVRITDIGIELKNVLYIKTENSAKVFLPSKYYKDASGKNTFVDSIIFMNHKKSEFINAAKKAFFQKLTEDKSSHITDPQES